MDKFKFILKFSLNISQMARDIAFAASHNYIILMKVWLKLFVNEPKYSDFFVNGDFDLHELMTFSS